VANCISQHLKLLSQDKEEKEFVTEIGKQLGKVMNLVRAFQQRLEEQMKKKQQQQQAPDPKVQSTLMLAKVKAKNATETHAQKMAQKELAFQQSQKLESQKTTAEVNRENLRAVHEFKRGGLKS